jgi:hypothetical protein
MEVQVEEHHNYLMEVLGEEHRSSLMEVLGEEHRSSLMEVLGEEHHSYLMGVREEEHHNHLIGVRGEELHNHLMGDHHIHHQGVEGLAFVHPSSVGAEELHTLMADRKEDRVVQAGGHQILQMVVEGPIGDLLAVEVASYLLMVLLEVEEHRLFQEQEGHLQLHQVRDSQTP